MAVGNIYNSFKKTMKRALVSLHHCVMQVYQNVQAGSVYCFTFKHAEFTILRWNAIVIYATSTICVFSLLDFQTKSKKKLREIQAERESDWSVPHEGGTQQLVQLQCELWCSVGCPSLLYSFPASSCHKQHCNIVMLQAR